MLKPFYLLIVILFLSITACGENFHIDFFKQTDLSKEFIELVQEDKFEEAYKYFDPMKTSNYTYQEFSEDIENITKVSKKYGTDVFEVKTDKDFMNSEKGDLKMTSLISLFIKSAKDNSNPSLICNFIFNSETNKILDFQYLFRDTLDRLKVPFRLKDGLKETNLYYYDEWQVENRKVLINSISLAYFTNRESSIVIKVAHDLSDKMDDDMAWKLAIPIIKQAIQKGCLDKASEVANMKRFRLSSKIGVTFWRVSDGVTYTVFIEKVFIKLDED